MVALALGCHRVVVKHPVRGMDVSLDWLEKVIRLPFRFAPVEQGLLDSGEPVLSLTFDDGHRSIYARALPVLSEAGVNATAFVSPGQDGESREMLLNLLAAGWEIGSHSLTHPPLDLIDTSSAAVEIRDSRRRLENMVGANVSGFAFPYGRYGLRELELAAEAGYTYVVGTLPAVPATHHRNNVKIVRRLMCDDWTSPHKIGILARSRIARWMMWLQDEVSYRWSLMFGAGESPYRILPEVWSGRPSNRFR